MRRRPPAPPLPADYVERLRIRQADLRRVLEKVAKRDGQVLLPPKPEAQAAGSEIETRTGVR